jgi:hypothetical protein
LHLYEVRPRKDRRGFDLINDALPFGRLRYGDLDAITNAIACAKILEPVTLRVDQAPCRSNFRCDDVNYNINVIKSAWRREKKRGNIKVRDLTPVKDAKGGGISGLGNIPTGPGQRPTQKRGGQ